MDRATTTLTRSSLFVLGLVLSAAAVGCSDDPKSCESESDCFQGEACVEGRCVSDAADTESDTESPRDAERDSSPDPSDVSDDTSPVDSGDTTEPPDDTVSDTGRDTGRDTADTMDATDSGDAPDVDGGCQATPESCNGKDDDCDGQTDEGFDSDGDGTADCMDGCPNDPNKTSPGVCGCGSSDKDSDGDGTADCNDDCPNDPNKTSPGICGCGTSDKDSDGDGVEDCVDGCPNNANKTSPDTYYRDSDSDGYGDPNNTNTVCSQPLGYTSQGGDCDDSDSSIHPGRDEANCYDGEDNDCDGSTDCDDSDCEGLQCDTACSCTSEFKTCTSGSCDCQYSIGPCSN